MTSTLVIKSLMRRRIHYFVFGPRMFSRSLPLSLSLTRENRSQFPLPLTAQLVPWDGRPRGAGSPPAGHPPPTFFLPLAIADSPTPRETKEPPPTGVRAPSPPRSMVARRRPSSLSVVRAPLPSRRPRPARDQSRGVVGRPRRRLARRRTTSSEARRCAQSRPEPRTAEMRQ